MPFEVEVITEVKNFRLPPKVDYKAERKKGYRTVEVVLDNTNFEHQLLDKLIIPEILLHEYPCKLSSQELYQIVRQHVKENIDPVHILNKAKIVVDNLLLMCYNIIIK